MTTALVQVRVDDNLKSQATDVYSALGMDLSTAVRIFLKRSVIENGIPFSMTLPKNKSGSQNAAAALDLLGKAAVDNGTANMTLEEINAEIDAVRSRQSKKVIE